MQLSYTPAWKVACRQSGLLTSIAASSTDARLTVALKSGDLLLIDIEDGTILATLSFETMCSVQTMKWYSASNIVVGCDNSSLYDICFEPANTQYSVTMCPVLATFNHQIRLLTFDPDLGLLAVAYANMVELYMYKAKGKGHEPTWNALEIIKGPYNNEDSLVNALLFYPSKHGASNLFIGYAKAGWSVRSHSGSVKRVSPDSSHNVCQIGSAALSHDKKQIAMSTLDHTIAVYALESNGPVLSSMKEVDYEDTAWTSPIVPIAFTLDGLTLGGTACGDVIVFQDTDKETSLIRHGGKANHIIRVIATHGQKIVIGSSSEDGSKSVLKCYSSSAIVSGKPRTDDTVSSTAEKALLGWDPADSKWKTSSGAASFKWRIAVGRTARLRMLGIAVLVLMMMLFFDPPNGVRFADAMKDSQDTDIMLREKGADTYWLIFGVRYFSEYFRFQVTHWTISFVLAFAGLFTGSWEIIKGIAGLVRKVAAKWMCERVGLYKKNGVCPKFGEDDSST
ncbi:hypothetical protein FRC12_001131 [Ceratobasidium sp. 428]|nr:hypothetical protein FRC12_001131 [Ceratobasidium sp. 428]